MVPSKQGTKTKITHHLTDTESYSGRKSKNKKNKKKSSERRRAKQNNVNNFCVSNAMTTWAENFTVAATWQLKHQLAYWKARAVSLQYENNKLHEVIRRNHLDVPTTSKVKADKSNSELEHTAADESDCPTEDQDSEQSDCDTEENDAYYTESELENEENKEEDFEVSEEFIQFLTANAKYKEDAKRERERLKAKLEEESSPDVPEPQESAEDKISRNRESYGDKYKRIIALEIYLMSDFQNEMDKHKAAYWPNIPFNFNS